jgi:oxaloacetate decarboxylase gamma subunit
MQDNLMQQGVELMLFGMGTVFVFLAVLIVATTFMSFLIQRFFPAKPLVLPQAANRATSTNDDQLVAVISAAIHKFRSRHK